MCVRARSLAQVFAHVVDPENPLQFEDFDSDDDEEDKPPICEAQIPQGHIHTCLNRALHAEPQ